MNYAPGALRPSEKQWSEQRLLAGPTRQNHTFSMIANALTIPMVPDFLGHIEAHFRRELSATVHDWSQCVNLLAQWEDEHLLDHPTTELLKTHQQATQRLVRFGRLLALTTEPTGLPDRSLAEIVTATQNCLQDKLALWHRSNVSETRRTEILTACFSES
jgi:hypothetical protein